MWTQEKPTADGYYWFYFDHDARPAIVQVFHENARFFGGDYMPVENMTGWWLGPITSPANGAWL